MLAASVVLLVATAVGAFADPPGPTNYRSEVTGVTGAADGVSARIYGGDSFLELTVAEGTGVIVPGYREGELYLRFDPDGAVFVNQRSEAHYLNQARYGEAEVDVPDVADVNAPPDWVRVAGDGTYAWHDHRIHWMGFSPPPQIDTSADEVQPVLEWEIPIEVDDQPATIRGDLVWIPPVSPALPIAMVAVALAATVAAGVRSLLGGTTVAVALGAAAGVVAGGAQNVGVPAGAESQPLLVILPAVGAGVVGLAWLLRERSVEVRTAVTGLAGVPLIVTALLQLDALTASQLAPGLPAPALRSVTAALLGVGAGGLVAAARAGLRAMPDVSAGPSEGPSASPADRTGEGDPGQHQDDPARGPDRTDDRQ